jgi:hypothetical protein
MRHVRRQLLRLKPANVHAYRAAMLTLEDFWLGMVKPLRRDGHSNAIRIG